MKSIQLKITVYVVSSLLLLFVLLLFTIDTEMEKTAVPLSKNLTEQIVNARGEQISYWIEQRIEELEVIAHNIAYFDMNKGEALAYMQSIREKKDNIYESFGIVDKKYVWVTDGSRFSIHNREYYKEISESGMDYVISDPISSKSNQVDIIVIMYRLKNVKQSELEYISAAVPLTKIRQIASDIHLYDGTGQIVDNTGSYIGNHSYEQDKKREKQRIMFQSPISKSPGWVLTFQVTESKLKEGTRKVQHSALLIGCFVGLALIILLTFFSSSIVKPIRNLQKLMGKVETGDLSVRFEENKKDEIGQLGRSFNQMLDELYKTQYEKRQMELRLMQEQIKPHFLYNTLDTIQWMAADYEADEVVQLIEALSTYFRIGLSKANRFITLEEELDHIESYLQIQKARYEDLLSYEIKYDDVLVNYHVIRVLLQPLVENAIYHGIEHKSNKNCTIIIEIFSDDNDDMFMKVKNNGMEIDPDKLIQIQTCMNNNCKDSVAIGFGLYSVNHRLKLAFGEKYGLTINSSNGWTTATIKCPLIERSDEYVESINCR
jgi:two-component system sensor histidine kinase YesM